MTREQMIDKVIRRYGFEATETIGFCIVCENNDFSDDEITTFYKNLMD